MGLAFSFCSSHRNCLVWSGRLLCGKDATLHTASTLGCASTPIRTLVLTDLAPDAADVVWYSMRTWIEGGFKDTCARRMAMASNQNERSRTGQSLVVGNRGGDFMGGERWR